jgi:hypothetical protein
MLVATQLLRAAVDLPLDSVPYYNLLLSFHTCPPILVPKICYFLYSCFRLKRCLLCGRLALNLAS